MATSRSLELLGPAVEAARKALADLEPEEVPARLRKIAASSGRNLPKPLATSLVAHLDEAGWLRDKALDVLADGSAVEFTASRLFLERPDGWAFQLADLEADSRRKESGQRIEELERSLAAAREELDVARQKAKRAAGDARQATRAAAGRAAEVRSQVAAARAEVAADLKAFRRELAATKAELEAAHQHIEAERAVVVRLRSDLHRLRQAGQGADHATRSGAGGWKDSLEMARTIDINMTRSRPDPPAETISVRKETALALPAGVAPDSRAAVAWMLSLPGTFTLVVDGYNAAFHRAGESFSTSDARLALLVLLANLRRSANGKMRIVVVFDSKHGQVDAPTPASVEVRWDPDADEAVRRLAAETAGDVVVISSDREVIEGAERAGALVIWSEALATWRG